MATAQGSYDAVSDLPGATAPAALSLEQISRSFGDFLAITDISLDVRRGEFLSLVGPSGCGKSTLLKIVAGLLSPSKGRILVDGRPVSSPRDDIGLMFQTPTLFPWRTVVRNITLPLDIRRDKATDRERRVGEVLDLVGLRGFEEHYPRALSGGMQQRVALCRLLIADPRLMLLDEPFGALDEFTREHLNAELARISEHEGKTNLFVTHNIAEAVFLSDRVAVMGNSPGRILEVLDVNLPRPRKPGARASRAFGDTINQVREILGLN